MDAGEKTKVPTKKKSVAVYLLSKVMTDEEIEAKEGTNFTSKKHLIIDHDADV